MAGVQLTVFEWGGHERGRGAWKAGLIQELLDEMNKKMRRQRPWRWERKEIFKRDFASGSDSTPDAHT